MGTVLLLMITVTLLPTLSQSASLVSNINDIGNRPFTKSAGHTFVNPTDTPCKINLWGDWASGVNVSISPNPPAHNKPVKFHLKFYAFDNVWFASVQGNVTRLGDQWVYTFEGFLCDAEGICPIQKGETRVYDEEVPSPSTFVNEDIYTAWVEVKNQDRVIIGISIEDCKI